MWSDTQQFWSGTRLRTSLRHAKFALAKHRMVHHLRVHKFIPIIIKEQWYLSSGILHNADWVPLSQVVFTPSQTSSAKILSCPTGSHNLKSIPRLLIVMLEAARTSDTSENFYQTTWRNIQEDNHFYTLRRGNLKSHMWNYTRLNHNKCLQLPELYLQKWEVNTSWIATGGIKQLFNNAITCTKLLAMSVLFSING